MHLPNSVHTFPRDCFYKAHHITFLVPYETTENPSPYHHLLSLSFVSHSFSLPFALCAIITLALLLLLKHPKLILCHFTRALSSAWSSLVSDPPWLTLSQYQSLFLYYSSRKESFQCTLLKNSTYVRYSICFIKYTLISCLFIYIYVYLFIICLRHKNVNFTKSGTSFVLFWTKEQGLAH